jgi:serine protease Do
MKNVSFGALALALGVAVTAAVSTLLAQAPDPAPRPEPRTDTRVFRVLDGRGSRLGVMVEDLTAEQLRSAGGVTNGVRIGEVDRDGAAEKAGLREGDLVVEYDGERVRSARQFSRLVQETPDGRTVTMAVQRGGQRQTMEVTPESGTMTRGFDIDGDRIRRDVERGLRDLDHLPYFKFDGPVFDFEGGWPLMAPRARLGVQLDTLSPQLADYFGVKDGGVLVTGVTAGSAAEKAGLKAGDVIVSVDGDRVRDVGDLQTELRDAGDGEVSIGVIRDRQETTLKATIESERRNARRPLRPAI